MLCSGLALCPRGWNASAFAPEESARRRTIRMLFILRLLLIIFRIVIGIII
jgi:hypothetical protein